MQLKASKITQMLEETQNKDIRISRDKHHTITREQPTCNYDTI
jgi:hypothetical protein